MNRALPLLACILLAAAVWALWPSADTPDLSPDAEQGAQEEARGPAGLDPQVALPENPLGAAALVEEVLPSQSADRDEDLPGFVVRGQVQDGSAAGPLLARLVYGERETMELDDWFHRTGLSWTKPKPLRADGRFVFDGDYRSELADQYWRVEVGIAAQDGDEFRGGTTPMLTLGTSGAFPVLEQQPHEVGVIATLPPIELRVPLHDWHLMPEGDFMLTGEFEKRPFMWHGRPYDWFQSTEGPRTSGSIRLSPWHDQRQFRAVVQGSDTGLEDPVQGEWFTLSPGVHELEVLRPRAAGMLEIFFPNSRALFPPSEKGLGIGNQVELRLSRFDAKTSSSFESRVLIDPTVRHDLYDASWGLAPEPAGGWQGDTYVARVGWIDSGSWQLAVEARHLNRAAEPRTIEIAPFDVTRVEVSWLEPGKEVRIVPPFLRGLHDQYVLRTWARMPSGEAHVYRQGLITQGPRELVAPPGTIAIASISHWHGTPENEGEPTSRLSYIRGEWAARRELEDGSIELPLQRSSTRYLLEFAEDTVITGGNLGEIRGRNGEIDGQAIQFAVSGSRSIELAGFPPGFYDVRVAPRDTSTNESRFFPWRTIEIRSQPSQPSPGSAGSGN